MAIIDNGKHRNSMLRPFIPEQGRQVPVWCPEIPEPAIYNCKDQKTISVFCRAQPGIIAKYLEHSPLEYVNDNFIAYICDMNGCEFEQGGFWDMGIIVPVRYSDVLGASYIFEYESSEHGICAGRELWGYPKKYADCTMEEKDGKVIATGHKRGVEIFHLEADLTKPTQAPLPDFKTAPHLQLHTVPAPDGPYIFSQRVIMRDTSMDYQPKRDEKGAGTCILRGVSRNPLDEFMPAEIYGATYSVGDFFSTEENGWAKVLATII